MNKTKSDKKVIKTKFGIVMANLSTTQQKLVNELAFTTTNPTTYNSVPDSILNGSSPARRVPELEIKKDHLLISEFSLIKNLKSGEWEISLIKTNQGEFATSEAQTKKIDQSLVRKLTLHLKEILEPDLLAFLEEEK